MDMDDTTHEPAPKPDVGATIAALQQPLEAGDDQPISATIFYGLSGLLPREMEQIAPVWAALPLDYRRRLIHYLIDISEVNFELDYAALGMFALGDPDADVREAAIELLFEDESAEYMNRLIEMAQWDESTAVRAAAASALGRFIMAGEYEELPESDAARAQDAVVNLWTNESEDLDVRRRALESLANSSHELVPEAIEDAYQSYEPRMRVSALFAMGRTCDARWHNYVMRELNSDDPELLYEAARAAGELELHRAVQRLVILANGSDREIAEVAIWSLGEIGGEPAKRALNALGDKAERAQDDALVEAVEDALASAELADLVEGWDEDDQDGEDDEY